MSEKIKKAVDEVSELADALCAPDEMSQEEAKEFLEDLIGDLEIRLEALKEERGEE
jgi:polyhydroxyalkanoate synthesis regulator phasin